MATALSILLACALSAAPYRAKDGAWSAEAPAGWETLVDTEPEPSVSFIGPLEPGLRRRTGIICAFYAKDHPDTPTPESFRRAMSTTAPIFELRAKAGKPLRVAGVRATRFSTSRLVNVPDTKMISRDVRSIDDFVIVPVDGGFYALQLSASEAHYPKVKPAFERFLKTFSLGKPKERLK
ncbi:MAG: hypothetical protein HY553_15755 [Elusimicrobia bacterium]|nr:hypothetical protein [Elusimicrobiota bacterium]